MLNDKTTLSAQPRMNVDTAQIYTDLSGVQQLKAQGNTDKAAALKNIAHQFEAMMVQMMMKSMRDANAVFADGDMTSSSDEKFYQDMFDNQLSLSLSKGRGFGIAEALLRQLQGRVGGVETAADAAVDHRIDDMRRVQASMQSFAPAQTDVVDNPRMTAAIQDALHALFGASVTKADTPAKAGASKENASANAGALDGTPSNFVNALRPLAQRIAAALGVDGDVLLSQSALETGWGQKVLQCADGSSSFNFFNIKAGDNWQGAVVKVPTIEYENGVAVREWANFRAYNSPEESFADYARLIGENPRYREALQCGDDPRAFVKALAEAGYATDPRYAQKVLAVLDGEHMQRAARDDITALDGIVVANESVRSE